MGRERRGEEGKEGEGGMWSVCVIYVKSKVISRCKQWSCYSSLTTEKDDGSSEGSNGRFHQFPHSEVGQRNH